MNQPPRNVDNHVDVQFGPLTPLEMECWTRFAQQMGYDHIIPLSNADTHLYNLQKPSGYVADMPADAPFCPEAFVGHDLFFGLARAKVTLPQKRYLSDSDKEGWLKAINVRIRDDAKAPREQDGPNSAWVPSLGQAGFIRIDEDLHKSSYFITVVAGLPRDTYHDLDFQLQNLYGKGHTMHDVFIGDDCILETYRQLAKANRARLVAEVALATGLHLVAGSQTLDTPFSTAATAPASEKEALAWFITNGGKQPLPAWFKLPYKAPALCSPVPESIQGMELGAALIKDAATQRYPVVAATQDVMFHDVFLAEKNLIRVMSSAVRTNANSIIPHFNNGPAGNMFIYNATEGAGWSNTTLKHAFAVVGRYEFAETAEQPTATMISWENPDLEICRMQKAVWHFEADDSKRGTPVEFHALVLRLSAWAPDGFALPPPTTAGRFKSIPDDAYVPGI